MPLFTRRSNRPSTVYPPRLVTAMAAYARFAYDPVVEAKEFVRFWDNLLAPLYELASASPGAFLAKLRREVTPHGGWAAYGAGQAVWELVTPEVRAGFADDPTYNEVIDASLDFLRRNGVPPNRLSLDEWDHWIKRGGTVHTWIPPRPSPRHEQAPIAPPP